MNDSHDKSDRSLLDKSSAWAAVALITIVLAIGLGDHFEQLILGWLYFPSRVIPRMTVDVPTVILGAVCLLLFVMGLYATVRWFRRVPATERLSRMKSWTWRSSLSVAATLIVLFAAGTSFVAATHQLVWLLSDRNDSTRESEPVFGVIAQARESGRRIQAKNQLKQAGLAFHNFHVVRNAFPPGGTMDSSGQLLHGWAAFLGPYHSYDNSGIDFRVPWNSPPNDRIYKCQLSCFVNPSQSGPLFDAEGYGLNHWAGNIQVLPLKEITLVDDNQQRLNGTGSSYERGVSVQQIKDGTSNTILIGSARGQFKPWGHPANLRDPGIGINTSDGGFGGPAGWGGAMFVFCDGSIRMVSESTDPGIVKALGSPAGELRGRSESD